jgi:hypothetical protein
LPITILDAGKSFGGNRAELISSIENKKIIGSDRKTILNLPVRPSEFGQNDLFLAL